MTIKAPLLQLENLACRRAGRLVFKDINLKIMPGELIILTGPNGSGKSSLLRLLAGLIKPAAGRLIGADDLIDDQIYIGHQLGLKPAFSLLDNAVFYAEAVLGRKISRADAESAADHFGLLPLLDQPVRLFSSGQARRAGLMRLFLAQKSLWLLDEPTVGLDQASRHALTGVMRAALMKGTSMIVASHDPLGLEGRIFNLAEEARKMGKNTSLSPDKQSGFWQALDQNW